LLVREAVSQLNAVSRTVETYRTEMDRLASQFPEYKTVMVMTGVGKSMGPQLMAEIGDIRRFAHKKSIVRAPPLSRMTQGTRCQSLFKNF
jgi:hypothetical protein